MGRPFSQRQCSRPDCDTKHFAKGLCRKHYHFQLYHGKSAEEKAAIQARKRSMPWLSTLEREEIKPQTFSYLKMRWEQIGQLAAARRFTA